MQKRKISAWFGSFFELTNYLACFGDDNPQAEQVDLRITRSKGLFETSVLLEGTFLQHPEDAAELEENNYGEPVND